VLATCLIEINYTEIYFTSYLNARDIFNLVSLYAVIEMLPDAVHTENVVANALDVHLVGGLLTTFKTPQNLAMCI